MAAPQEHPPHQPRINHRRRDVLNELSDSELIKRYKFDREGIIYVTDLVREAQSVKPAHPSDEGYHNIALSCHWENATV